MRIRNLVVGLFVLSTAACYHAIVETGLTPNGTSIKKEWAHSWLGGLIPPSTVETVSKCPNGVARVETQHSFLNMVANVVTSGIYSPMTIQVECAAAKTASADVISVPKNATPQQKTNAVQQAVQQSDESGEPVFLQF